MIWDALFYLLMVADAIAAIVHGRSAPWPTITLATLLALVYAAGVWIRSRPYSRWVGRIWLVTLAALWIALSLVAIEFVWVVVPLYFIAMFMLPTPTGVGAVGVMYVAAVAAFYVASGSSDLSSIFTPAIAAIVAVTFALVFKSLARENEARRRLIVELSETRAELAKAERAAGVGDERRRLAREMHDTIAAGLSGILMSLQAAAGEVEGAPHVARGRLETASELARDCLRDARTIVSALAPPELERRHLADALDRLCARSSAPGGVDIDFHTSGDPIEMPTATEASLLRIAQGAIANVVRHANARRADVTLTYLDDGVALDVVDDGIGFDPSAAQRSGAYGIATMRDRIDEIGGELVIEASPGAGVAIAATAPLPSVGR